MAKYFPDQHSPNRFFKDFTPATTETNNQNTEISPPLESKRSNATSVPSAAVPSNNGTTPRNYNQAQFSIPNKKITTDFKPFKLMTNQQRNKAKPIVKLNIDIGSGKTGTILVRENDNPYQLARNFSIAFQLRKEKEKEIADAIIEQIQQYFSSETGNSATNSDKEDENEEEVEENDQDFNENEILFAENDSSQQTRGLPQSLNSKTSTGSMNSLAQAFQQPKKQLPSSNSKPNKPEKSVSATKPPQETVHTARDSIISSKESELLFSPSLQNTPRAIATPNGNLSARTSNSELKPAQRVHHKTLFKIEVELVDGQRKLLSVKEGVNPEWLSKVFAEKYHLDEGDEKKLCEMIEKQLEEFTKNNS